MWSPVILYQDQNLIAAEKPSGFNTHAQDVNHPGFCEVLAEHLGQKLYVVHRLDRDTSGVMLFAKTREAAQRLTDLFVNHQIQKEYLFVSHALSAHQRFYVSGEIYDEKKLFKLKDALITLEKPSEFKSLTSFELIDENLGSHFRLYKASPLTGKSHQIRLHAEFAQIPLLGDDLHGGLVFERLMLHASSLQLPDLPKELESVFQEIEVLKDHPASPLSLVLDFALINKNRFIKTSEQNTYRLRHLLDHAEGILADIYNRILWVYWYQTEDPLASDLAACEKFCQKNNLSHFYIRKMLNRGTDPNSQFLWTSPGAAEAWTITENNVKYELRDKQGLSPGLFLDQADQRAWTLQNSKDKKVLNLFSYTCGFSVCAALGKAETVTSVDVSVSFLDWGKKNFSLNNLDPYKFEFFRQDIFLFIKGAQNRKRKFDLIICDPPSFGRSKESVWKIEKDLKNLLKDMWSILNRGGQLLLTCNYESWTHEEMHSVIQSALNNQFEINHRLRSSLDFEPPQSETLLKGFLITKK